MRERIIFFILLIFISGLLVTTAGAVPVIIGFKDKAHPEIVQPHGEVTHSYKYVPAVAADLPEQAIENLKKNPNIAYIEPDYEVEALGETVPWGITKIETPAVHASGNKGSGVNVAIIDTGIDYTHPDLAGNYIGGYDFVNKDSDPMDDKGHGTHCAGIIAAVDNEIGVIGVAPAANLYALKILDNTGSGSSSNLIAAIEWAIDTYKDSDDSNDIQIISMSLGSNSGDLTLQAECSKAYYDYGILLVAAAGNDGIVSGIGDTVDYPGAYSSVIAVAATDSNNVRASFSSTGPDVELAAPGVGVYSTYLGGYTSLSGTSMACPHVAGTAALVLAANPSFTNENVRAKLANTATDLGTSGRDTLYGFGLVNAETAGTISIPDTEPPEISYVIATAGTNSATITWTTDEASNSTVIYWKPDSNQLTNTINSLTTNHAVELDNLNAGTTYSYQVQSTDASENTKTSGIYEFTTNQAPVEIEMWVKDISMVIQKSGVNTKAVATVSIQDENGKQVEGATVYGKWSGSVKGEISGITDVDGKVSFSSNWVKKATSGTTFNFSVTAVDKSEYRYNSSMNTKTSDSIVT